MFKYYNYKNIVMDQETKTTQITRGIWDILLTYTN